MWNITGTSKLKLILFISIFISFYCEAQRPYIPFRHYTNEDGLSQNKILSIYQDKQGFMWFGTLEGLSRFDGYEFRNFNHKTNDTTSLGHDFVNTVTEDTQGTLWVGTGGGLSRYNKATNIFYTYKNDPHNANTISSGLINQILEDKKGNFWIAFATGYVDYFDRRENKFYHFPIDKDLVDVTGMQIDRSGNLWIATQMGITVLNEERKVIEKFTNNPENPTTLSNNNVNYLFYSDEKVMWVGTDFGLDRYDETNHNFIHYYHDEKNPNSLNLNVVKCISQDGDGRLWIGMENGGLDIFEIKKNVFYHFKHFENDPRGISDNSIYVIFRDRFKNMWIGTNSAGINFYDKFRKPFVIYQNIPGMPSTLSHNKINAITEQPGVGFWIATDGGGVNFFDETTSQFKAYKHEPKNSKSLPSDFVVDVLWDEKDNCLWIATWGGGLSQFKPSTKQFINYQHSNKIGSIASNDLWRLYLDKDNTLYIGSVGKGFSIFNKKDQTFENYGPEDGLREENAVSIFRDNANCLWLGSWGTGLSRFNLKTKQFIEQPKGITINSNESILPDHQGRIWVTGNPGMQCYDPKTGTTIALTANDGLPETNINSFVEDSHGNFWLSTNKGISKYNMNRKESKIFSVDDGLPTNQYAPRLLRTSNGKMYFGSVNGIVVFHPDSIKENENIPLVVITDFKVFNKTTYAGSSDSLLQKHISETKELWLPYEYNFISLSFVALSYSSSQRNQYMYKLEGFDKDWVTAQQQRVATYTSLDPGDYTFIVKASNNDGYWNDKGASLVIHILPPWWATIWFRALLVILFGMLAFGYYYYRVRAIENRNRELNLLVKERTKELNSLNEEIIFQNKELIKKEEDLAIKNNEISEQRDLLTQQNLTLMARQDEIETQNEELKQSQEEISAQRDIVFAQNYKLDEARIIIEKQNEEIKLRNENLEVEIASRTKELLEYNHQLEQFAFISAHNLRSPVARILGLGNILDIGTIDETEKHLVYQKMVSTARELDRVVRDLNTILEIKKNNNTTISIIDFKEELVLVMQFIEKEIKDTRCKIDVDFSAAPSIKSVKPYVESIFQNLLTNAIKYRHPNRSPVITIKTEPVDDYICLTVNDNGLGIDTETYKGKIFNLYQRFHTHVEGKGLGLYLIKTQILTLGGKIELDSTVDVGTTFRIYFKAAKS